MSADETTEIDVSKVMEKGSKKFNKRRFTKKRFFKKRPFNVEIELVKDTVNGIEPSEDHIPVYATKQSAAADLKAFGNYTIPAGEHIVVRTGIKIKFYNNYVAMITPRSGLALRDSITVLNAPGYIDSDYRGEIGVILVNHSDEDFEIQNLDRIAQISFLRVNKAVFKKVEQLSEDKFDNTREEGGFGSTGTN